MKSNSTKSYTEARARWADEQSELFLDALEQTGMWNRQA